MRFDIPASPYFRPLSLVTVFDRRRSDLPAALRPPTGDGAFGERTLRGIPFSFGPAGDMNVLVLDSDTVRVNLPELTATYCIFVHAVADTPTDYLSEFADSAVDGNTIGGLVSEYSFQYTDGSSAVLPIIRRFATQQSRIGVGASPFAAVPARDDQVVRSISEDLAVTGFSTHGYFDGLVRHESGRDAAMRVAFPAEMLWIYALPNPHPDRLLAALELRPCDEISAVYAATLTTVSEHPLRAGTRRKVLLQLPTRGRLNAAGELDDVAIDLGVVISARAARKYDIRQWLGSEPFVKPQRSETSVVVEFAAHPVAKLFVADGDNPTLVYDPSGPGDDIELLPASDRPVRVRIIEMKTGAPAPVRLHFHGPAGEYLPPRGHQRKVNSALFEDSFADFTIDDHQFAYVDGDCIVDLPLGTVYVEIARGYETAPVRRAVTIDPDTKDLTFEVSKALKWREKGWVTADTHVHFLSPQTALLEGKAEGINVVNLLATQLGEMFSNVGDFDGRTTFGARDFGGDGEFLVRVGSENRMQVLGHISLLGYSGSIIHPLATGGPSESSIGDPLEVTMADWARRCLDQRGLVIMPHSPNPQLERAADIVLNLIDAIELMTQNPLASTWHETSEAFVDPYGIADWYRYLNLGYHLPIVGGSDKMAAAHLLGGIRTYTHLGEKEFTYDNWMSAIRSGNTFATIGPLASIRVAGVAPGSRVELPSSGGTLDIEWEVESVATPIAKVEVVVGGLVADQVNPGGVLNARGTLSLPVKSSTWVALRVRGSYHGRPDEVAAHTSAVEVLVEGSALFSDADASVILDQIGGALAYVDTLAPRVDPRQLRRLRATLEASIGRLNKDRLHRSGGRHHIELHRADHPHEH